MCTTHAVGDAHVLNGGINSIKVAHAFGAYGGPYKDSYGVVSYKTTLNNCIMTGTTSKDAGVLVYDIGLPNNSSTFINGGQYGRLYAWKSSHLWVENATIDTIDSGVCDGSGSMVIGPGTTVGTITAMTDNKKFSLKIMPGANVGTINYNGPVTLDPGATLFLVIMPGATVDTINYSGTSYEMEDWIAKYQKP
jgi:hypothetical protein